MPLYEVTAAPQFITKYAPLEEIRTEVTAEYIAMLRYLLTTQKSLELLIWSEPEEEVCHFAYNISNDTSDVVSYLSAHDRVFRHREAESPDLSPMSRTFLHRAVDLIPVGSVERAETATLPVLPPTAPRYTNFDPNVMGQTTVSQVLFAPLTQMAGALVRDRFTPEIAYLAPIPRHLSLEVERNYMWRSTFGVLSRSSGMIRITCSPHSYTSDDIDYALLCLQYFLGTHASRLSNSEVDLQTDTLRGITTRQPLYEVSIEVSCNETALQESFLQDTDGEAFTPAPSPLERALMNRIAVNPGLTSRGRGPRDTRTSPSGESPARLYGKLFELNQLCRLLLPPFTLKDALPGIPHFVPRPFQEPFLETLNRDARITLGTKNGGAPVEIGLQHVSRHIFVTGASGTGKTNTLINLVRQIHQEEVPVLIVDPAKRDFEPLMKALALDARVYDFASRWIRFNPFIPPANTTLYAHSIVLAKTLSMLFPTNAVAYEMLLGLVKSAYWDKLARGRPAELPLTMEFFAQKTGADLRRNPALAPTFDEFLDGGLETLAEAANRSTGQFAREAFEHFERRFTNLRKSLLSIVLRPNDPAQLIDGLFSTTSLVELGGWFDQDESNALFALIFSMLYEQRLSDVALNGGSTARLAHVAVLDEAHRIVPAETSKGDSALMSAASQASGLLTQMIAECRALGQGLVLAEQSASNISPHVLINTSTKLVHSVFFGRDKEFLRSALSLSNEEEDFLAYLDVGQALAFTGRTYQPLLVKVPKSVQEG